MTFRKECVKAALYGLGEALLMWGGIAAILALGAGGIWLLNTYAPPLVIKGFAVLLAAFCVFVLGSMTWIPIKLRLEEAGCLTKKENEEYED